MIQALPPPPVAATPQTEIVVTGTALPAPRAERSFHVERIRQRELHASGAQPLDRLIERLAGVQQFRRADSRSAHPTSQGITLRALGGNAASRALVLLDGVPQSDPFGGWIAWPSFSTLGLAEVRLSRGGGSVTAGPGALAGTLELSSSGDRGAMAIAEAGSRSSLVAEALLTESVGEALASLSARAARSDGFIPIVDEQRGQADRRAPYRNWSGRLRWVVPLGSSTELQASLSSFADRRQRGVAFTGNRTAGSDVSVRAVSHGATPWSGLLYFQSRDFRSSFAGVSPGRETARRVSLQYDVPGSAIGWSVEVRPRIGGDAELRLGIDGRRLSGESREFANYVAGQPTRQRTAGGVAAHDGLFAELSGSAGKLSLTASARGDRWRIDDGSLFEQSLTSGTVLVVENYSRRSGWRPTGRVGATLDLGSGITLRSAAYAGWRLPTLNELFRPFRAGSDATAANPLLKPERLRGAEAGADWRQGDWKASATYFNNRLVDPIANITLGAGPGNFPGVGFVTAGGVYRQRRNLPGIDTHGLEASGGWSRGALRAAMSFSVTDAAVRGSGASALLDGLKPAQSPLVGASFRGGWETKGRSAELIVRYEGARFEDDLNRLKLPAAMTVDLSGSLPLSRTLSLFGRAENLFGEEVISTLASDGLAERGTPRTLWAGLRITARP
jgi:outer membrane receptor protein involved in Fe transport